MKRYQKKRQEEASAKEKKSIHIAMEIDLGRFEEMIREGLSGMARDIGVEIAESLMADEVNRLCGPRRKRSNGRQSYRYGSQGGFIRVGGQRVSVQRPRVRSIAGEEVQLHSYRKFQHEAGEEAVLRRLVRGVSCRDYKAVVDAVRKARGISSSAVSRGFVEASSSRVRELAERQFHQTRFVAIFIDGVVFARETVVAALGVTEAGEKRLLAVRHGATENLQVCTDLLADLQARGVRTDRKVLFVIDGSKALRGAIDRVWGQLALVQRCQVHKLRNVKAYVPEKKWPEIKARIQKAYRETSHTKAKKSLEAIGKTLQLINPHAANSLREGLDETITVIALQLTGALRQSMQTTNMVESVFSRARMMTTRVKRWRPGQMRERWCATALLHAEQGFHRIYGHSQIAAQLLSKLDQSQTLKRQSA